MAQLRFPAVQLHGLALLFLLALPWASGSRAQGTPLPLPNGLLQFMGAPTRHPAPLAAATGRSGRGHRQGARVLLAGQPPSSENSPEWQLVLVEDPSDQPAHVQPSIVFAQLGPNPSLVPAPASEALPSSPVAPLPSSSSQASVARKLAVQLPDTEPVPAVRAASPDIVFESLEELQAKMAQDDSLDDSQAAAGGLPTDVPADLVPSDFFSPYASSTGSAATPGTADAAGTRSARNQPVQNISTLTSLLVPPPPGVQPFALSPEQRAAIPKFASWRKGTATVTYNRVVGNFDGGSMNCMMGYLNDYFKDHFVGIPTALYRSGELCGACVRMVCADSVCNDALLREKLFMITDSCRDCQANNLVTSARGYWNLTGLNYNINPTAVVAWEFTSCAPLINGTIKMLPNKNNRGNYLGLNFSNAKVLLRAVAINNLPLTRTSFGYWIIDTPDQSIPLKAPFDLLLVGANGQRLSKRLSNLRAQDLGIQF